MTAKKTASQVDFADLCRAVTSTTSLLNQFEASLNAPPADAPERPRDTPNILMLVGDSAKLLKAQVTKLSLLVLNKPFTPTAITRILRDVSTSSLPALMTAADLVREKEDGKILSNAIRSNIRRLFTQTKDLFGEIPLRESDLDAVSRSARGTLASTGVVWETCDILIGTGGSGLAGLVVQQAQEYKNLLQDAITELKDWREGGQATEPDFSDDFEDSGLEEDPLNFAEAMPEDDPLLRAQVETAVKTLQHVHLIYPPIIKRRLKRFPATPPTPTLHRQGKPRLEVLDEVMGSLKLIPEEVDELAAACYQQNREDIKSQLASVRKLAVKTMEVLSLNWEDEPDEFTSWSKKWLDMMSQFI
ncbi:hypothetical protein MMC16_000478 [Acarospora aff. strigata]|nr:hypothetical protein [Acarospora aff. strigata]